MNQFIKSFTLLFILQASTLHPIELPWYQHFFNKGHGIIYRDNCNNINTIQNIRCIALTAYHRITHKKAHLDEVLGSIKTELTEIKKWMLELEQEALLAIKEKYQISDATWKKYLADLHRMKTIFTKGLKQSHPDVIHDPNIPANILEILTNLLQQNGINPQSIHLKMVSDQEKIDKNQNTIARAITYFKPLETTTDYIISYEYFPPSIEIFPYIHEKSMSDIVAICAHEVQHLAQHHGLTDALLMQYFKHYCNINKDDFENSPEYHTFSQIQEAQAEILSAVKDPQIAACLKNMRRKEYYPDNLYEDHFFHLAYINSLWKMHGWLEYFIS